MISKYLQGECLNCGIDMLVTCLIEEDIASDKLMKWKCYVKIVHGKTRASLDNKVLKLHYKETTMQVFLSCIKPTLQKFIVHNFVVRIQKEVYKICLDIFLPKTIMLVIDFVENYTFMNFNEEQKMHRHSFQLTISVHISYQWNLAY
jgi:hypothetical protein